MSRVGSIACAVLAGFAAAAAPTWAQEAAPQTYDYGGAGGGGGVNRSGFTLLLEGAIANPRNTDTIVAIRTGTVTSPVLASWDNDFAGRIGLGYQWGSGNSIFGQAWGFGSETSTAGTGAVIFGIGPPIAPGFGDQGTAFDIDTEIDATTADFGFGHRTPLGDSFEAQWTLGVRYAHYEEGSEGTYTDGATVFAADKALEGEMLGVRGGVGATWQWKQFLLQGAGALSLLDGEVTADSGLRVVQNGSGVSALSVTDDGRSGSIWELELLAGWRNESGSVTIGAGWEQQVWEGITSDLARDYPGAVVAFRDRDSIAISGYKARISLVF